MTNQTWIEPPPPQKGLCCFAKGCLILIAFTVLLCIAFIGGSYLAVRYLRAEYFPTTRASLPAATPGPQGQQDARARWDAFERTARAHQPARIELTADDINALIQNDPQYKDLRNKLHVMLEGDQIKGQVSMPMDDGLAQLPGLSKLKGRFLNGSAALKISLQNGTLLVTMQSLQVKGQSPPENIMAQLRAQNLAQNIYNDPKNAETMRKLESIEVKDGKITIKSSAKE